MLFKRGGRQIPDCWKKSIGTASCSHRGHRATGAARSFNMTTAARDVMGTTADPARHPNLWPPFTQIASAPPPQRVISGEGADAIWVKGGHRFGWRDESAVVPMTSLAAVVILKLRAAPVARWPGCEQDASPIDFFHQPGICHHLVPDSSTAVRCSQRAAGTPSDRRWRCGVGPRCISN